MPVPTRRTTWPSSSQPGQPIRRGEPKSGCLPAGHVAGSSHSGGFAPGFLTLSPKTCPPSRTPETTWKCSRSFAEADCTDLPFRGQCHTFRETHCSLLLCTKDTFALNSAPQLPSAEDF
jgi:hypothetical protein